MKKTVRFPLVYLIILALSFLTHCTVGPSKSMHARGGKPYGRVQGTFRGRWWNYYERGLFFAEGRFFQEAVADLKQAIVHRSQDQRRARTYGMHFIDYFPHRELGVIYYETGDLMAARKELEYSQSHFPSAKARFYLDLVRKGLIKQDGREVLAPRLTLGLSGGEQWTSEDPVVISGLAEDDNYVAGITIRGIPLFLESSQKRIPFHEHLNLAQGTYAIEVAAKNLLGKVTRRQVVIHVDREGPIISLDALDFNHPGTGSKVRISGSLHDEVGVRDLCINGQPIPIQEGGAEAYFTAELTIDQEPMELIARDTLGNQTSARIPLETGSRLSHEPVTLACADYEGGGASLAGLFGLQDERPPVIVLKGWTDVQTVFLEKAYIEGQVSDESQISSLTVNGTNLLRRKGCRILFSYMASLEEGRNILTIQAGDEAGNQATRKIAIIRQIPQALHISERLSLTVFPFERQGEASPASFAFQHNLIDALVNRNRFRMIERDKLEMILQEQKLSRTRLFDERTALKLGRLTAAQAIIAGSIIETRTGIEIVARMIDTETSEILTTVDVYHEAKDLPSLMSLAEGMAIKLHRDFPLVSGLIIECRMNNILTDLGQDAIKLQRRLIVYREEMVKHPLTRKVLGADTRIIGLARVTQVMPNMSKAELVEGSVTAVKPLDKVISQ